MASDDYYRIANLEKRLNPPPDREFLHVYGKMVNNFINEELRSHLGNTKADGSAIVIPLTNATDPARDNALLDHADSLVIAMYRAEQSGDKEILDEQKTRFRRDYLIRRFGYSRDIPFDQNNLAEIT